MNKNNRNIFGFAFLLFLTVATGLYLVFGLLFKNAAIIHLVAAILAFIIFGYQGGVKTFLRKFTRSDDIEYSSISRISYVFLLASCYLLSLYLVQTRLPKQLDTTSEGVYTLNQQTKNLLSRLKSGVRARYFMRGTGSSKSDLDLLTRYSSYSKDFYVSKHDLDKERPLADSLGISEINSLHISLDDEDKSPGVLISGGLSEEGVTNGLLKLIRSIKPVIYFSAGHGEGSVEDRDEAGFSLLKESLESDGFMVERMDLSKAGLLPPQNSAIIFLNSSKDLLPLELDQVKSYAANGGGLIIFTEPKVDTNLHSFLAETGFKIGNDTIVGIEKFTTGQAALGVQPVISKYATHPSLKGFDKSVIISAAVSIRKKASADQITEIAFSDPDTWAETNLIELYSKTPTAKKDAEDILGPVSFAAVYENDFKDENNKLVSQRMAVVGDLDFIANVNLHQLFNRDFVLNIVSWVVGDEENVSIRVGSLKKSKKIISESEYSNIFIWTGLILPELILLFGIYSWQRGRWR